MYKRQHLQESETVLRVLDATVRPRVEVRCNLIVDRSDKQHLLQAIGDPHVDGAETGRELDGSISLS